MENKNNIDKNDANKKLLKIFIYLCIFSVFLFLARYILDNYLYEENQDVEIYEYGAGREVKYMEEKIIVYDENLKKVEISPSGKLVIINLWAIWCGYCKDELPHFDEIAKEYSENVQVYMVCSVMDKSEIEGVMKYVREKGYEFEVYFDLDSNLVSRYNVLGFPTTVFLDKDLNTLAKNVGALNKANIINNINKYK